MTIPSSTNKSGPYFYNGVATTFDYEFKISDETHIRVVEGTIVGGLEVDLVLGVDYTVTGVGNDTGSVVISPARPAGKYATLVRNVPFVQETDLQNQGAYYAETVEAALDDGVARDQQLMEMLERAVTVPVGSDLTGREFFDEQLGLATAEVVARATTEADRAEAEADEAEADADRSEAARDIAAGYASDAVSQGNVPIYATAVGIAALNINPGINAFRTNGYYAAGDGGDALYSEAVAEPAHEGKLQSADGRWWALSTRFPTPHIWGGRTAADMNKSMRYSRDMGGLIVGLDGGNYFVDDLVELLDGVPVHMAPNTRLIRSGGYVGPMLQSENFAALTGTNDTSCPRNITLLGRGLLDGKYMIHDGTDFTAYDVADGGNNLNIYAKRMFVEVISRNAGGVGFWSESPSSGGPASADDGRQAVIWADVGYTKYEGIVWKGPSDHKIDWMLQKDAGAQISSERLSPTVSPTYGASNGGFTDGAVFDTGAEIEHVHCFGNRSGQGFVINGGRFNANMMMSESNRYGGVSILDGFGRIENLEIHRSGGYDGDIQPMLFFDAAGENSISWDISGKIYHSSSNQTTPRNLVEIGANARHIKADFSLTGDNVPGHGIVIETAATWYDITFKANRINGIGPDGLAASAVYRKAGSADRSGKIEGYAQNCDVVLRTQGAADAETINITYDLNAGQAVHAGDPRLYAGQAWCLTGVVDGVYTAKVPQNNQFGGPTLVIAAGAITYPDHSGARIDTEGGAATDDLDTINGGVEGDVFTLLTTSSAKDVTVKNGTGNIRLDALTDKVLNQINDRITLQKGAGGVWAQVAFSNNGA